LVLQAASFLSVSLPKPCIPLFSLPIPNTHTGHIILLV
jgi:hypothetical protein